METNVDQAKVFGTLLTDLSKAFDYLPLDLFLAKLQAYWFDNKSLGFVQEQVQVQNYYLSYHKVLYFVPFFFNIHLCDQFIIMSDIDMANFLGYDTLHTYQLKTLKANNTFK